MLPVFGPKLEEYIAPAKNIKGGWVFTVGLILLFLLYFEFTFVILLISAWLFGVATFVDLGSWLRDAMGQFESFDTPQSMITVLFTFVGMFAAVLLTVRLVHDRGLQSLIGTGRVFQNFLIATCVLAVISMCAVFYNFSTSPGEPNLPISNWLRWLPLGLVLLLIQVTAEELIFRGYLLQELAIRFKNRLIWFCLPSIIFAMGHYDPQTHGANAWIIVLATGLFGVFLADITVRTGNLGAAIGMHFANNFFAMFVFSLDGTLTGLSLYVTPFTAADTEIVRKLLYLDIATVIGAYVIYLIVLRLKQRR